MHVPVVDCLYNWKKTSIFSDYGCETNALRAKRNRRSKNKSQV